PIEARRQIRDRLTKAANYGELVRAHLGQAAQSVNAYEETRAGDADGPPTVLKPVKEVVQVQMMFHPKIESRQRCPSAQQARAAGRPLEPEQTHGVEEDGQ